MKSWGLETEVRSYSIWMPHPVSTRVWRISPDPIELNLQEGSSRRYDVVRVPQVTPFNGYALRRCAGDCGLRELRIDRGLRATRLNGRLG